MTMTDGNGDKTSVLHIDGEMTIYRALELKQVLLARLEESPTLELDLSGVTELDTAGVQLLMLAGSAARARQGELRIVAQSAEVTDVLRLLNLETPFHHPSSPNASAGAERSGSAFTSESSA